MVAAGGSPAAAALTALHRTAGSVLAHDELLFAVGAAVVSATSTEDPAITLSALAGLNRQVVPVFLQGMLSRLGHAGLSIPALEVLEHVGPPLIQDFPQLARPLAGALLVPGRLADLAAAVLVTQGETVLSHDAIVAALHRIMLSEGTRVTALSVAVSIGRSLLSCPPLVSGLLACFAAPEAVQLCLLDVLAVCGQRLVESPALMEGLVSLVACGGVVGKRALSILQTAGPAWLSSASALASVGSSLTAADAVGNSVLAMLRSLGVKVLESSDLLALFARALVSPDITIQTDALGLLRSLGVPALGSAPVVSALSSLLQAGGPLQGTAIDAAVALGPAVLKYPKLDDAVACLIRDRGADTAARVLGSFGAVVLEAPSVVSALAALGGPTMVAHLQPVFALLPDSPIRLCSPCFEPPVLDALSRSAALSLDGSTFTVYSLRGQFTQQLTHSQLDRARATARLLQAAFERGKTVFEEVGAVSLFFEDEEHA